MKAVVPNRASSVFADRARECKLNEGLDGICSLEFRPDTKGIQSKLTDGLRLCKKVRQN